MILGKVNFILLFQSVIQDCMGSKLSYLDPDDPESFSKQRVKEASETYVSTHSTVTLTLMVRYFKLFS